MRSGMVRERARARAARLRAAESASIARQRGLDDLSLEDGFDGAGAPLGGPFAGGGPFGGSTMVDLGEGRYDDAQVVVGSDDDGGAAVWVVVLGDEYALRFGGGESADEAAAALAVYLVALGRWGGAVSAEALRALGFRP